MNDTGQIPAPSGGAFLQALAIALGAGATSALLFTLSLQSSVLAKLLAALAPTPIMAVGLGFTHWSALLAGLAGAFGLSVAFPGGFSLIYFGALALPAWHLARLAVETVRRGDGEWRWRRLSELALWAIAIGVVVAMGWVWLVAQSAGGDFDAAAAKLAQRAAPAIEAMIGASQLPAGVSTADIAETVLQALPVAAAGSTVAMLLGNLWLAGRMAAMSGQLARPWPDVAVQFALPRIALGLLAGGLTLAFADGAAGRLGWVAAAATFMGFSLQGLAAAHFLSRDWPQRRTALLALYVTLGLVPWSIFAIGLLGVVDSLFGLRARKGPPAPTV